MLQPVALSSSVSGEHQEPSGAVSLRQKAPSFPPFSGAGSEGSVGAGMECQTPLADLDSPPRSRQEMYNGNKSDRLPN